MMFMNLNKKSSQTQAGSSPYLNLKSTTLQTKYTKQHHQQIDELTKMWATRLVSNDNTISYQQQNYASDKNNKFQQMFSKVKSSFKRTFTNTVYTPLTFYEFHMIDHLHKLFKEVQLAKIAEFMPYEPYIPNFLHILAFTKQIVSQQSVQKSLKSYVVKTIDALIKQVKNTKFASADKKRDSLYTQAQTNILLMILTFKSLQKEYSPYVRKVIKRIFNQLSADSFMNTTQTLRYLQNQRGQIQIMPQLTEQELTQINNRILTQTFDKYHRTGNIPKIMLKKVSQDQRRKVVNILVSGFLSQDQDKKSQWKFLLNCMPDSQVYGLDWQSQTIGQLIKFMGSSIGDLTFGGATLEDKFKNNPFNPAFTVAQDSGKYLAHIVDYLFPNQFINIIGYSLGTELIKQFVKTTIELNKGKNLQKIVLLGGVSDLNQFDQVLQASPFPLSITNMYTANDTVLQVLLKRCRKGIQPIGLKELVKSMIHCIDNTDVSTQISGHLAYMMNFGTIAELLQLSEE